MTINRRQGTGKQDKWTIEELSYGLSLFYEKNKHYPTSHEVDGFEFLPSSRSIQRRFGGLVELRKTLKLSGQNDYTKGEHSSLRAKTINQRAHKIEQDVYTLLVKKFGIEFVHREYLFTDDSRTKTDFFVRHRSGSFSVDVFYPNNRRNMIGCINSKLKKYENNSLYKYPVIFLQMNKDITEREILNLLKNKKNKLKEFQHLMCIGEFEEFCASKKSNKTVSKT